MTRARKPRGSVVVGIATRNRAPWLRRAIASALRQSRCPLRVVVVDDASDDETPLLRDEFGSVCWERRERAQGCVRARNAMMLTASEDYYVSLDDDAWFTDGDEIAVAVNFLERNPYVAAVAFDIICPDRSAATSRGTTTPTAMFVGCGHMLRLSVVRELGGFTEFPRAYGAEEKDFCLRLIDAGYAIVRLDGVHVWHDKASLARDVFEQHRSGVCNDLAVALRRVPGGLVVLVIALKMSKHLLFSLRSSLVRPCLQGFGDFMLAAFGLWRERGPVRLTTLARFLALSRRLDSAAR